AVRAGTARVVGTREDRIVRETARLLDDDRAWRAMAERVNPYGDGRAAARTVQVILHHFGLRRTRPPDFHP
ncbi:MAG: UDP-N-acetylglucosamine 2-epimerase, partial [bacterium]